jgi:hypothetical protein
VSVELLRLSASCSSIRNFAGRLRSGIYVETAAFHGCTIHPRDNAECVGPCELGRRFDARWTLDIRRGVTTCCAQPSRAMDGAWRDEMDAARLIARWKRTDEESKKCGTPGA